MAERCEAELCPNWSGDGDACPCAVFDLPRPVRPAEVREVATWFTMPTWTTAHEIRRYGSLGHIRLWVTLCGREYRLPDHEVDDAPIQAPPGMRRCGQCLRRGDQP